LLSFSLWSKTHFLKFLAGVHGGCAGEKADSVGLLDDDDEPFGEDTREDATFCAGGVLGMLKMMDQDAAEFDVPYMRVDDAPRTHLRKGPNPISRLRVRKVSR
jgi:hypothetical protein